MPAPLSTNHGAASLDGLRVPAALRPDAERVIAVTDAFCAEHLDTEYGQLCRKLVAKLARKRPSPLERGDLHIWAAASIYAIGGINFLFDRAQTPHLSGDDLSDLLGVPKSTMANKAKRIRDLLGLRQLDVQFCRKDLLASHPMAWLVEVDGFVVDARWLPPGLQEEARRRGLIPDLSPEDSEVGRAA